LGSLLVCLEDLKMFMMGISKYTNVGQMFYAHCGTCKERAVGYRERRRTVVEM
jgi:hypothetical protein